MQGDVIKAVNGEVLKASGRSVNRVVEVVRAAGPTPVHFDIERAGQGLALDVRPTTSPAGEGRIGVQLEANAQITKRIAKDAKEAAFLASRAWHILPAASSTRTWNPCFYCINGVLRRGEQYLPGPLPATSSACTLNSRFLS